MQQQAEVIIFDTETTGFKDAEIIEAAWLVVDHPTTLHFIEGYHERFKPTKPIELGALSTHHILAEELEDCRPSAEFRLPEGLRFLVGHNVDYDWEVAGKPDVKRICTLALSRWLWPDIDAHNQTAMMYFLCTDHKWVRDAVKQAHSALHDVRNCQVVLSNIIYEIQMREGPDADPLTWDRLWEISEVARIPTKMTFGKHKGEKIEDIPYSYVSWLMRQPDLDPYLEKALRARK